jgi:hypothetical protein
MLRLMTGNQGQAIAAAFNGSIENLPDGQIPQLLLGAA